MRSRKKYKKCIYTPLPPIYRRLLIIGDDSRPELFHLIKQAIVFNQQRIGKKSRDHRANFIGMGKLQTFHRCWKHRTVAFARRYVPERNVLISRMASFKRALTVAAPRCTVDVNGWQRRRKQAAIATYQWFRFNWHSFRGQRYYPPCSTCPASSKSNKAAPAVRNGRRKSRQGRANCAHFSLRTGLSPSLTFIKLEFHWAWRHMCVPYFFRVQTRERPI